ncbi:putative NADH dehydrogenase 1 alpha subcomplex subunit 5 [Hibiscus syriacus]|uniref:NADH dehydrogenase 1 alpha subcomplex subunit 5 n=1 Tax=Hibiscus syriacus TaxID=106335 RepID=A0A6A3CKT0_HIBSY|nr:putative NADH dehydrogenase 1 alpha subcomplex subunit 5 [Hibiscus syriacus]
MASDLETKAKEAFIDDHFELALDLYSQAVELNPKNAELYADRAQANIKLNNLPEAVADANKAIELDPSMSKAYLRKAFVDFPEFFRFPNAFVILRSTKPLRLHWRVLLPLAPGDSRFSKLIKECEERIAATKVEPVPIATNAVTAKEVKHSFYQKPEEVVVTIFSKGIPRECVKVDYGEQIAKDMLSFLVALQLSVSIEVPGKDAYHFQPRLFGKIIPDRCRCDVLSTKIEVRLVKAEPIHWTSLEFSREVVVPQRVTVSSGKLISVSCCLCYAMLNHETTKMSELDFTSCTDLLILDTFTHLCDAAYRCIHPPKLKRVDWDKIEAQVKEEKDEKLDGDAALNKFFRDIYQDADEDARRAMQKSFVESNGTVLSTNWKEVGVKKVEGSPPDGMEMKKWEY